MTTTAQYAEQSAVTDPGVHAGEVSTTVSAGMDLAQVRRLVSGLIVHYRDPNFETFGIPEERRSEIDTRYAERMIERLGELAPGGLRGERPPSQRLVGCCRDFTVLTLTLLRAAGVPARARIGFAGYFAPGWWIDHVVAEVWDAAEGRWRLVDAQLGDTFPDPRGGDPFSTMDVPRDLFLTGPAAWLACRAGAHDPERFVVAPDLMIPFLRSWFYLRHNLIQDLAALDRREMLLWDTWGLLTTDPSSPEENALLDRIAETTARSTCSAEDIAGLYDAEPRLRVPPTVVSISPLTGEPCTVDVAEIARCEGLGARG